MRYRRRRRRAAIAFALFVLTPFGLMPLKSIVPPDHVAREVIAAILSIVEPTFWLIGVISTIQVINYRCPACGNRFAYRTFKGTFPGNTCRNCGHQPPLPSNGPLSPNAKAEAFHL